VAQPGTYGYFGDHRLLCGDSTDLKDGKKAALVATDPPYCIDYTGERPNDSGKDWSDSYDEVSIKDPIAFFFADRGHSPSHDPTRRLSVNRAGSSMVSMKAVAVIGPTPFTANSPHVTFCR
jgi:hypothetical protein